MEILQRARLPELLLACLRAEVFRNLLPKTFSTFCVDKDPLEVVHQQEDRVANSSRCPRRPQIRLQASRIPSPVHLSRQLLAGAEAASEHANDHRHPDK